MTHFQITIQLPLKYNNGEKIEESKFKETYEEVLDITGGITINPRPLQGAWIDPNDGIRYDDETITFSVLIDSEDKITALKVQKILELKQYKEKLKERFNQKEIFMVATRCSWL